MKQTTLHDGLGRDSGLPFSDAKDVADSNKSSLMRPPSTREARETWDFDPQIYRYMSKMVQDKPTQSYINALSNGNIAGDLEWPHSPQITPICTFRVFLRTSGTTNFVHR